MAKKTMAQRTVASWRGASLTSRILLVGAIIAAITGSITGIATALPLLEPYWYVSRAELRLIVDKQAVATDRQTLYQLKSDLDRANKDLKEAPSHTVRERVEDLRRAIDETDRRVRKATGQ